MILSLHKLTAFWFPSSSEASDDAVSSAASKFLDQRIAELRKLEGDHRCEAGSRSDRSGHDGEATDHDRRFGRIHTRYDPYVLDSSFPGYKWWTENIRRIKRDDPDFDDAVEKAEFQIERKRNPFPAAYWQTQLRGKASDGADTFLEVLVGTDVVVFHQYATYARLSFDLIADDVKTMHEKTYLAGPEAKDALFTAETCLFWPDGENELARGKKCLPKPNEEYVEVPWDPKTGQLRLYTSIGLPVFGGCRKYEATVLVHDLRNDAKSGKKLQDLEKEHRQDLLNLSDYVNLLCVMLVNDAKVQDEYEKATAKFRRCDRDMGTLSKRIEAAQTKQDEFLSPAIPETELKGITKTCGEIRRRVADFGTLVETCRINANQFRGLAAELRLDRAPFIRRDSRSHRVYIWNMQVQRRRLSNRFHSLEQALGDLRDSVERARSLCHAQDLIRFSSDHGPRAVGTDSSNDTDASEDDSLPELITFNPESLQRTHWRLSPSPGPSPEERAPEGTSGNTGQTGEVCETFTVFRPSNLYPENFDNLTDQYELALRTRSARQLLTILEGLFRAGGVLNLSDEARDAAETQDLKREEVIQTDQIKLAPLFKLSPDRGDETAEKIVRGSNRYDDVYCEDVAPETRESDGDDALARQQHWVAFQSLMAFMEALIRVFSQPSHQHSVVLFEDTFYESRILFLAGVLRCIANHRELAKGYFHKAVECALERRQFAWAFRIAQVLQNCPTGEEQQTTGNAEKRLTTSSAGRAADSMAWRSRLAGAFLRIFDLPSAVAIARQHRASRPNECCRSSRISWWLRIPAAALIAFLLVAGLSVGFGASRFNDLVTMDAGGVLALMLTALAGVLTAPTALVIGTWGSSRVLSWQVLYPRLLGAITLGFIAFVTGPEVTGAIGKLHVATKVFLGSASLVGAFVYLYWEVIRIGYSWREGFGRCLDMLSLGFLESVLLATFFVAVFGSYLNPFSDQTDNSAKTVRKETETEPAVPPITTDQPNEEDSADQPDNSAGEESAKKPSFRLIWPWKNQAISEPLYFSPLYTLLMASMFLFLGIVIQLMFEPSKLGSVSGEDRS